MLYIGIDDEGHPVENTVDIATELIDDIPVTKIVVSSGLKKPYYIKSKGMSPNGC